MGVVWEDASNKVAYGIRRRYFTDGAMDSIMNYPYQKAIIRFLRYEDQGQALADTVMTIAENYPAQVLACNMNMLGTHDTPRILTALVDNFDGSREALAERKLSQQQRQIAMKRLELASVLQYTLPGSPSIYYGDEAGMEGGKDPFNRRTYPWGREDQRLLSHFRQLGQLRRKYAPLRLGDVAFFSRTNGRIGFTRTWENTVLRIYVNRNDEDWVLPDQGGVVPAMGWRIEEA